MGVVIGIDPSTRGFHAACLNDDDELLLYSAIAADDVYATGVLHYAHSGAVALMRQIRDHWGRFTTNTVFVEEPVVAGARNLRTSLKMAESVGALVAGITTYTSGCYLVPVSRWKKATVGKGTANKGDVALWLSEVHPQYSAACDGSQDYADSCCIALYGVAVVADSALVSTLRSAGEL